MSNTTTKRLQKLIKEVGRFKLGKVEKVLGEGAFGCTVYGSEHRKRTNTALVKILRLKEEEDLDDFIKEAKMQFDVHLETPIHVPKVKGVDFSEKLPTVILKQIRSNCPVLMEAWKTPKKGSVFVFLAMTFADKGTLRGLIENNLCISLEIIRSYIFQILYSLAVLNQQKNFLHRDVKPENFVLESIPFFLSKSLKSQGALISQNKKQEHWWLYELKAGKHIWNVPIYNIVQIIDFGLSEFLSDDSTFDQNGSLIFMSPDSHILNRPTHSKIGDLWGVGCILLELSSCTFQIGVRQRLKSGGGEVRSFLSYMSEKIQKSSFVQDFTERHGGRTVANLENQDAEERIEIGVFCSILIHMFGNPLFLARNTFKNFRYNDLGKIMLTKEWQNMITHVYNDLKSILIAVHKGLETCLKNEGLTWLQTVFSWPIYESNDDLTRFLFYDFFNAYKIETEFHIFNGKAL